MLPTKFDQGLAVTPYTLFTFILTTETQKLQFYFIKLTLYSKRFLTLTFAYEIFQEVIRFSRFSKKNIIGINHVSDLSLMNLHQIRLF